MRAPAAVAAHLPRLPRESSTSWALRLLLGLCSAPRPKRLSIPRGDHCQSLSATTQRALRRYQFDSHLVDYGTNWTRFEAALTARKKSQLSRNPLVSVPTLAETDWCNGSLHIRPHTFLVAYEGLAPVFLTREPRSQKVIKISLKQMRQLHCTWRRWPAVLPSMLLTVLWHWPLEE